MMMAFKLWDSRGVDIMHMTLSRLTLSVVTLLFLTNCAEARSVSQDTVETDYAGGNHDTASTAITPPPSNRPSNTQFSDVLFLSTDN